jgi:hypothetical protein
MLPIKLLMATKDAAAKGAEKVEAAAKDVKDAVKKISSFK